jgi:hypothetical protein
MTIERATLRRRLPRTVSRMAASMVDDITQYAKPRSKLPTDGGPRVWQFSLLGLFLIVTVPALILATYFGVGRLAGMSTTEILTQGLGRLVYGVPSLLVWAVGLTVAIRRLKRNRVPARLTAIALGGLMLTTFALQVVQMVLIHWVNSGGIRSNVLPWYMAATGVFYALSNAVCWILVIVAIFVRRPPDEAKLEQSVSTGDPFQTSD